MCVYLYVSVCVCMLCVYVCTYMCVYMCVCTCMCVCYVMTLKAFKAFIKSLRALEIVVTYVT